MIRKNVDVVIIVEHLNRELESALLLENALDSRGISAAVVFKGWNEGPASCILQPKIVVTPWCYDDNDVEALCGYRGGFSDGSFDIVDLHSEQVTTSAGLKFVLPTGRAKDTFHVCWGSYFEEALLSACVSENRISVAGSNRLDFFRDEYRYLSATKEQLSADFKIDINKHWILFVGNYSAAFLTDDQVATLENRNLLNIRENRELSKRAYDETLVWVEETLNDCKLGDCEFIYRPHPSEPISEKLTEMAAKHPNLHVVKSRAIRDWFLNCELDFNWCSTSSVEAAYAGLPVFVLRPFDIPDDLQFALLETIEKINSSAEMRDVIRRVLDGDIKDANHAFIEGISRYYKVGGSTATSSIADSIEGLLTAETGRFSCSRKPLYCLSKFLGYGVKQLAYHLGLARRIPAWRILADDHITKKELGERRRLING